MRARKSNLYLVTFFPLIFFFNGLTDFYIPKCVYPPNLAGRPAGLLDRVFEQGVISISEAESSKQAQAAWDSCICGKRCRGVRK